MNDVFEVLVENTIATLRESDGLSSEQLVFLVASLDAERERWRKFEAIPKHLVYSLIVLRDNIIGAHNHYSDADIKVRISQAESAVDAFVEDVLL